jgi:hypothetical protein
VDIAILDKAADLNVYKTVGGTDGCCAPAPKLETLSACCGAGQSAHAAMKAGRDLHDGIADLFRDVDLTTMQQASRSLR